MNALLPSVPLSLQRERDRMISVLDDIAAGRMAAGDEDGRQAADAAVAAVHDAGTDGEARAAYVSCLLGLAGAEVAR